MMSGVCFQITVVAQENDRSWVNYCAGWVISTLEFNTDRLMYLKFFITNILKIYTDLNFHLFTQYLLVDSFTLYMQDIVEM